ncbi:NAD(P)/FAD-dependent oxidoreductase [Aestuariivirga sp.]|uniref:flavin-containing monooxygenase n=1 Tax=Aestuariivirga sp. TaxID=2650926 RepID=UPI0030190A06
MESPSVQISDWLSKFDKALGDGDVTAAASMFAPESYWRDLVSFTWNITTVEGPDGVSDLLKETLTQTRPTGWALDGDATEAGGIVEGWLSFQTGQARGKGHIRLKGNKAFTLLTTMTELKGHEEQKGFKRALGLVHGIVPGRTNWLEDRKREEEELGYTEQPYCLIIGGGQGGVMLGARLKRLGVPAIIVEKNEKPGDSWRKRYKSLCLHDPVWYDHFPYLPFPDDWPIFAPKDKLGDWIEFYSKIMELNYWGSTEAQNARFDKATKEWFVTVKRENETVTLRPKHLVLATGLSGMPNVPVFKGAENFKGEQYHSSKFTGLGDFKDKRCVVIGSNNSAHDICAALWEHGADVTMIQKSPTTVIRSNSLMELDLGPIYSEEAVAKGITVDIADMISASMPYRMKHLGQVGIVAEIKRRDADLYSRLENVGFMFDFGDDESGLGMKYLRRGSGYYIDVGASDLIADGKIKLKTRVTVRQINSHSVAFSDGTELPADLIVYATGYGSMNQWAAELISQEVADKVGKVWGLGSATTKDPGPWEGEQRNMWKPTQQEALWFHGGNLHQSRHFSQFLSLQLKARMEGLPTPVYRLAQTHHKM